MNTPPFPWNRDLSLLLAWGEDEKAEHLLEQLNKVQRGFCRPDYDMPVSALTSLDEHYRSVVERDLKFTAELNDRRAA